MNLDIKLLIEKTEQLVHDGKINMAERGEVPVQVIEIDGKKFQLSVVMSLIK